MQPYEIHEFCFDYLCVSLQPAPEQIARVKKSAYEYGVAIDAVKPDTCHRAP